MQVLYVKWTDSGRHAFGWTDPEEIEINALTVETVPPVPQTPKNQKWLV